MIKRLYIKNLALIEECEIEFQPGLNIITGETGAGKSLVLGSLSLLLGEKADKTMIRQGANDAYVEAIFSLNDEQRQELSDRDIFETQEDEIIVSRKITRDKNIVRANSESINNKTLSAIVGILVDICGQRDSTLLLNRSNHLQLLDDSYCDFLNEDKIRVARLYKEYKNALDIMDKFNMDEDERMRKLDYDNFVYNEISEADLKLNEDEEIEKEYNKLNNYLKIEEVLNGVYEYTNENRISEVIRNLSKIKDYDNEISDIYDQAQDIESFMDEISIGVSSYIDNMSFSQEDFDYLNNRLNLINTLKSKYGKNIEEILDFQQKVLDEIEELNNYQEELNKATNNLNEIKLRLDEACESLSKKRQDVSKDLCKKIKEILLGLEFKYVQISTEFTKTADYTGNGYDKMGLLISLNKGENLKPLETIASGGELSRIMLAIKSVNAKNNDNDERTLIFDEIDAGIGGKTALSVANRLRELSNNAQVICITHLPSIAAAANTHYLIYKEENNERTDTYIKKLDEMDSVKQIAKMISGDEDDKTAISSAKALKSNYK